MKKYKSYESLIMSIIFLFFITDSSFCQKTKVTRDLLFWPSLGIEKELFNNFYIILEKELRFYKNISLIDEHFTDFKIAYELRKCIEVRGGLRWILEKNTNDEISRKFRYDFDVFLKYKINRFGFSYRFRFQDKNQDFFEFNDKYQNIITYRNRILGKYDIKNCKFTPYVSAELFFKDNKVENPYFSKLRFNIGTKFSINKINRFDIYYQIERELNSYLPFAFYCLGVKYKYKIK